MTLPSRALSEIERANPEGLSSRQILDIFSRHDQRLSEATLRKYVQLGLLPRSRRVGQKGKHRGSRGIYPVEVVRRVAEIRKAMENGETLESLASAAQAVRAKLSLVKVAVRESVEAAERELANGDLDRKARAELRAELKQLNKDARDWVRSMERWTSAVQQARVARKKAANGKRGR
jgi:DNA-binding transcriptional MerR regulator